MEKDGFCFLVSQKPRLLLLHSPSVCEPWRPQLNPLDWQIRGEREPHTEDHTESFYEPGVDVVLITFTHIPRVRLHLLRKRLRNVVWLYTQDRENGFSWIHTLCHSSAYCGSGIHIHFQDHEKSTSKFPLLYKDFWLSD